MLKIIILFICSLLGSSLYAQKNKKPTLLSEGDREGRMSWDQTAVLVGIKGAAPYYKVVSGTMTVNEDGSNNWNLEGSNPHYLVENHPYTEVQQIINDLMMHQPLD